jgi:phage tail sheath gpL-like
MTISFNSVPNNLRVPLFYAEFDNSRAVQGGATQEYRTLLLGNRLSSGTKAALTLHRITSAEQAAEYFGAGSVVADMAAAHLAINKIHPLYCMGVADNGSGVAATGKITIQGTPTEAGTLSFLIGGRTIEVGVATTDSDEDVISNLVDAINDDSLCLVSAAIDGTDADECNLTAKNKGTHGNSIDVRHSHYEDESVPAGLAVTIAAMASGATNPDVSTAWAALGDDQYMLMVTPWDDSTNIGLVETELEDRFGPMRQNDGYALLGKSGSHGTLTTAGEARNSQFTTIVGSRGPSAPWQWASATAAQVALSASIDPARPFQTLPLTGIIAPLKSELFTKEERNQLLYSGIATFDVNAGGKVVIEGLITTYKENAFGSPDTSYLYLNTLLTLSYLRFDWKARVTSRYPRHKLANDGTAFGPGQAIVTPSVIKAEAINKFKEWELKGLVEGFDQFKDELIVERNVDNPNRLDVLMPPDLVNQLVVLGTKIQFLL